MGRKVYQKKETYVTLEEVSMCLEENLDQAFSYTGNGIHMIKAQTGLGKTRMYINWIEKHPQAKVLVAAPTNTLKEQIGEDLKSHGITDEDLFITPSAHGNCFIPREIQEKISYFHEAGLHGRTKSMIASYYQEIKDDPCMSAVAELCENLMKGAKGMEDKRVVVTTHAYLLQVPSELLSQYIVIIDEDILYLQILSNSHCVDVETLERLSEKRVPGLSEIADEILAAKEGIYIRREPLSAAMPFTEEQLSEYGICCDKENDVNDLFLAGAYIKEDDSRRGSVVHYFCPQKLSPGKYIVLSATLNEKIYRTYFKKDMKVISYPEKKVAYAGTLKQYSYHSLGRNDLKKKTEIFEFIREYSGDPDLPVLTFKKFENEAGRSCKGLHFGNLTGINGLKGRDIGIIGTPYKNEEAYKLPACYLGVDVNKKEDARPHYQRVTYKGNRFLMMAYSDELLREIQLYSLESELEQAVGRARLLRNPCTVYLFSSFPCEQAKIYMKDYLVEPPEKEEPKDKFRVKPGLCRKLPPLTLEEVRRHRNITNHQIMSPIYAYPM
ncbi:MAG: DEAD/DEAH box helicase family protein [Clostridiales bacterium]|nr:DEAD/DEAH box helicase family protein [Clostridiales bacterium]